MDGNTKGFKSENETDRPVGKKRGRAVRKSWSSRSRVHAGCDPAAALLSGGDSAAALRTTAGGGPPGLQPARLCSRPWGGSAPQSHSTLASDPWAPRFPTAHSGPGDSGRQRAVKGRLLTGASAPHLAGGRGRKVTGAILLPPPGAQTRNVGKPTAQDPRRFTSAGSETSAEATGGPQRPPQRPAGSGSALPG